jgi:hypothetical protein
MPVYDDMPEGMGGGFLKAAGTYHFAVERINEEPVWRGGDKKGQPMGGFEIEASVQAGAHEGSKFTIHVREPSLAHKDGGAFARQIIKRTLVALGYCPPNSGGRIEADFKTGGGRQFVVTLVENDKGYLEVKGDAIYHVDDPAAPSCDRNQAAIGLIPKTMRFKPEQFRPSAQANGQSNGHANGNGNGGSKPAAKAPADSVVDDL